MRNFFHFPVVNRDMKPCYTHRVHSLNHFMALSSLEMKNSASKYKVIMLCDILMTGVHTLIRSYLQPFRTVVP